MVVIKLTEEEYKALLDELESFQEYKWNDVSTPPRDCNSKSLPVVKRKSMLVEETGIIRGPTAEDAWRQYHADERLFPLRYSTDSTSKRDFLAGWKARNHAI